ncbi:hypothetical protein BHM03_00031123 [Ensete ventricosum]|nr:hypothetical protein BHM03_00031123 [Ensete ventricosum]
MWARVKSKHRDGVRTMQWELVERLIEACRRYQKLTGSSLNGSEACREFAGSLLRVSEAYREFVGSLPEWHEGVHRKKTKRLIGRSLRAIEKLAGMGSHWKFARRFAERIGKFARNAKGDRRKEDQRTCCKITGGCQSMRDERWLDCPYHRIRVAANRYWQINHTNGGWTARTIDYGRRPTADGG